MVNFLFTWLTFSTFFALTSENLHSAVDENLHPNKRVRLTKLQKSAKGTKDIRNCFKPKIIEQENAVQAEIIDSGSTTIETSSSFDHSPIAHLVTYNDSYLAQIHNGKSMLFKHQISAEAWIKETLAKQDVLRYEIESTNSTLPVPEFDQARAKIIAGNPFALADEIIAKFKYNSCPAQIQPLDDGRFLARFEIDSSIKHNAFRYFDTVRSAEEWITFQQKHLGEHPPLTQQQKKDRKEKRSLMKRL